MKPIISVKQVIVSAAMAILFSWQATADTAINPQNALPQITFQVTTESVVPEDKVQIVLNSQIQATKLSKKQSQLLEQRVATLLQQLKSYPAIQLVDNHRNSYANYNNQGKITAWTSQATIRLTSDDFSQIAALIADLPDDFNLAASNFLLSPEKRKQQETAMLTTLLAEIQQKAALITQDLHYEQYRIVKMNITHHGGQALTREAPLSLAKAYAAQEVDNRGLSITPGETRLIMSANVVISLSEK